MKLWWQFVLSGLLVLAMALGGAYAYAQAQLGALQSQASYPDPEEGMQAHIAASYSGLRQVEIVRSGPDMPLIDDLWFVEARVWADGRSDGKAMPAAGDNPGCFFLHRPQGWILVPEGRHPELLAIALRLFGSSLA